MEKYKTISAQVDGTATGDNYLWYHKAAWLGDGFEDERQGIVSLFCAA